VEEAKNLDDNLITEKIIHIFSTTLKLGMDQIKVNSHVFKDLGADSLDSLSLVAAIEKEFNVDVLDEDIEKLSSVQMVLEFLNSKSVNVC
jgi:acyl carrier protein